MYISGIASGLDTETIIEQLMAIERRPLVLMQQRKNTLQQQRDAWRDINTRLNNLPRSDGGFEPRQLVRAAGRSTRPI